MPSQREQVEVATVFGAATEKRKLGQQAKHDSCVCIDSHGDVTRTKGG